MKDLKRLSVVSILSFTVVLFLVTSSMAVFMPPNGPLYIKFDNRELINVAATGDVEQNWGVVKISTIWEGVYDGTTQEFDQGGLDSLYASSSSSEITGMFAGITASTDFSGGALWGSGGSLYLYYDDTPDAIMSSALPGQRTTDTTFTNFTDGVLLVKLDFVNGAIVDGALDTSIAGSVIPTAGSGFTGFADSYGSVDLSAGGLWADVLDGNWFDTALGANTADLSFKNSYTDLASWGTGYDDSGNPNGIFGASSQDPARAYVVPEPSTFILLGAGLIGLVGWRRRNK